MPGFEPEKKVRDADQLTVEVSSWWNRSFVAIGKTRIKTWKGVAILAFIAGGVAALIWLVSLNIQSKSDAAMRQNSPLMKDIKSAGCVADGILSGYGKDTQNEVNMITHSKCRYLHRALETWLAPPDFEKAQKIMDQIKEKKPEMIFGMFLAEAINPNAEYHPEKKINFNFSKMCRDESQGFWGENTCKGYFGNKEYRKYLKYITQQAIDMGIQSFLFGQIFFQDNGTGKKSWAEEIVEEMRDYAREKGKEIVIGAQTNNIADEEYLRLFDFIEGGTGINSKGEIENGPCFSKWSEKQKNCWALLWNKEYSAKANNVLVHLDWSGFYDDDMSIFARMDKNERVKTVKNLYDFFTKQKVGFMLPYFAVINEDNGSCYGPAKNYYSASQDYSCNDEKEFNNILSEANNK